MLKEKIANFFHCLEGPWDDKRNQAALLELIAALKLEQAKKDKKVLLASELNAAQIQILQAQCLYYAARGVDEAYGALINFLDFNFSSQLPAVLQVLENKAKDAPQISAGLIFELVKSILVLPYKIHQPLLNILLLQECGAMLIDDGRMPMVDDIDCRLRPHIYSALIILDQQKKIILSSKVWSIIQAQSEHALSVTEDRHERTFCKLNVFYFTGPAIFPHNFSQACERAKTLLFDVQQRLWSQVLCTRLCQILALRAQQLEDVLRLPHFINLLTCFQRKLAKVTLSEAKEMVEFLENYTYLPTPEVSFIKAMLLWHGFQVVEVNRGEASIFFEQAILSSASFIKTIAGEMLQQQATKAYKRPVPLLPMDADSSKRAKRAIDASQVGIFKKPAARPAKLVANEVRYQQPGMSYIS
ncbi:MAG: hypothetical protein K0S08_1471 [Gammaproteobacteria bacterium]|jgi:hypothetical protein|nr:hypothetical protein [Gammaproteobacteria bacterium]